MMAHDNTAMIAPAARVIYIVSLFTLNTFLKFPFVIGHIDAPKIKAVPRTVPGETRIGKSRSEIKPSSSNIHLIVLLKKISSSEVLNEKKKVVSIHPAFFLCVKRYPAGGSIKSHE